MRVLLLLLLFPLTTQAQQGPIRVFFKNGSAISTDYVYLYNYIGFSDSFLRIDHKKGEKVAIRQVDHIEGIDQYGRYKYFKPVRYYYGNQIFAERTFTSARIDIYYTDLEPNPWEASYSFRHFTYEKDGGPIKRMKYTNLKKDIRSCRASMSLLKKGNGYRISQMLLYGVGGALVTHGIVTGLSNNDRELPPPGETRISIPPTFVAGAIGLLIPRFLNRAKQNYFVKALKAYQ